MLPHAIEFIEFGANESTIKGYDGFRGYQWALGNHTDSVKMVLALLIPQVAS